MKKIICIIAVVLMIASVVYAQKKAGIKAEDLAGMKGVWAGSVSFGLHAEGGSAACQLEILNDAVPVHAKFAITGMPDRIAAQFGGTGFESDDGALTTQGTIMFTGPNKAFLEISKSGKKLKFYYWAKGIKGDGLLTKK